MIDEHGAIDVLKRTRLHRCPQCEAPHVVVLSEDHYNNGASAVLLLRCANCQFHRAELLTRVESIALGWLEGRAYDTLIDSLADIANDDFDFEGALALEVYA